MDHHYGKYRGGCQRLRVGQPLLQINGDASENLRVIDAKHYPGIRRVGRNAGSVGLRPMTGRNACPTARGVGDDADTGGWAYHVALDR